MNPLSRFLARSLMDRELSQEMRLHLQEKVDELISEGHSPLEAEMMARRSFGNLTALQERSRDRWGFTLFEDLLNDTRFACRVLAKTPAFTVTTIVVLALGIGMNTAMFSTVKAVLLSRLPYPDPDRLVNLSQTNREGHPMNASGPDARDWRNQNRSMAAFATYDGGGMAVALSGGFTPRRTAMAVVSEDFFRVMGVQPSVGRTFLPEERKPGGRPAALVSTELATALFGNTAESIGKIIKLNGLAFTTVGVMPVEFSFPFKAQIWISQEAFGENNERSAHNYHVVGRLKDGVSISQAQTGMDVIASHLAKAYVDDRDEGIGVTSLYDQLVGSFRPAFLVLLSAVGCVLLIACANISSLQMARATVRNQEMALRTALGAKRARLIRQLLTESVLLALVGGALGVALAIAGCALLRHSAPAEIPRIEKIQVDMSVLAFTTAISVVAGLIFGLLPAIAASRVNLNEGLKNGSAKLTGARQTKLWGRSLVVGEIALAMVLLTGAALLLKSFWKLDHVKTGLQTSGSYTAALSWPTADGETVNGEEVSRLSTQLLSRVSELPGVSAVGLVTTLPVQDSGSNGSFEINGRPLPADPHLAPDATYRCATTGYFRAFGLPVLAGRYFDHQDDTSTNQVALVNQSFARQFFANATPLGKRIRFFGFDRKPQFMTIIGIVPDVRSFGLDRPARSEVFADYLQHTESSMDATLVVHGPATAQASIRATISSLNRDIPVQFESMDSIVSGSVSRERFETLLLTLFAGFAMLLAAIGIYGVLSFTVTRRTSEFGIRMALGAERLQMLTLVLREGLTTAAIGLVVGLLGALIATRALQTLLYDVSTSDPAAFASVAIVFAIVAFLGCYIPAYRAADINPNAALRFE